VKAWRAGDAVPRRSFSVLWNTETNQTYEAVVDLIAGSVESWTHSPDACPNFTIDEYHDVDHALHEHEGVLAALRERGTRFASAAVMSAWSYGGLTSTTSIPTMGSSRQILRTASSSSRADKPPGSGVPVPGACPGSHHRCRLRGTPRHTRRWNPLQPLLSEQSAPIPEGTVQHRHTHLGHDQEK
jgi:hypothetical protein